MKSFPQGHSLNCSLRHKMHFYSKFCHLPSVGMHCNARHIVRVCGSLYDLIAGDEKYSRFLSVGTEAIKCAEADKLLIIFSLFILT